MNHPGLPRSQRTVGSLCARWLMSIMLLATVTSGSVQARTAPDPRLLPDFSTLAENASPAVVNISTLAKPKKEQAYGPYGDEMTELLRRYFGIEVPDSGGRGSAPPIQQPRPQSLGSGFIFSQDGYILTNNHVVEGADEIIVRLNDRSEYKATLVGSDKRSDLAVLKVKARNLPTVKMGKSDTLKQGQWVFAIGSPFGFDYSVTKGIISAMNRSLPSENYVPFIQTDVPINPGNSGGPLLNMSGEVVGINSQIYSRTGGFMGVSFAIPADDAMDVAKQLREKGHVSRGWLGIVVQDVDRNLAESFGLKRPHGALLSQVLPDSPAGKAGLKPGDIITRFENREIGFSSDLPIAVGRTRPNKKSQVELIRRGKTQVVSLTVGELPDLDGKQTHDGIRGDDRLRISVANVDDSVRAQHRLDPSVQGVIVKRLGNGAQYIHSLRPGDIITHIDQKEIKDVTSYQNTVKSLPKNVKLSMRLIRNQTPGYITFQLKE